MWRANANGIGFHWRWQPATTVPRPLFGGQRQSHNYTFVLHFRQCPAEPEEPTQIPGAVHYPYIPAGQPPGVSGISSDTLTLTDTDTDTNIHSQPDRYMVSVCILDNCQTALCPLSRRENIHCPATRSRIRGRISSGPTPGSGLFLLRFFLSKAIRILLTEGVQSGLGRKTGLARRILWLI